MAVDQDADPDIQAFRTATTGLQLVDVPFDDKGTTLLCDVSTGQPRPLAPKMWRRKAFDVIHGLSHPGRKPSRRLVTEKFVSHGMKKDIRDWVKTCIACQRTKVHRRVKAPLEQFTVPERRFDHVNVDLVGPLPPSGGFTHLLTMVDRTTRWPEVVPLSGTTTAEVARGFIGTWIARFGFLLTSPQTGDHNSPHNCGPLSPNSWDLQSARYVFIRHDAHRNPLQPPYDGPYRVVETGDKTFIIDIGGSMEHISVDRLKTAHLDGERAVELARPPRRGRPPASTTKNPPSGSGPGCQQPIDFRPSQVRESRNRFGRVIRAPARYGKSVFVNSGGDLCVKWEIVYIVVSNAKSLTIYKEQRNMKNMKTS
ncbi:hypothetical protein AAFF_G00227310 [Aldrovandia affinis]|uniref:Gypsy retrotransposon integrase-like protein 1 n=1 Tax=Aldrovandia affinis TaxID=143900 RepID=A0AAD7TCQ7_9TELE|nr:hypothetical protein AAFF_G00227310 [Aldrovandia affinis]